MSQEDSEAWTPQVHLLTAVYGDTRSRKQARTAHRQVCTHGRSYPETQAHTLVHTHIHVYTHSPRLPHSAPSEDDGATSAGSAMHCDPSGSHSHRTQAAPRAVGC